MKLEQFAPSICVCLALAGAVAAQTSSTDNFRAPFRHSRHTTPHPDAAIPANNPSPTWSPNFPSYAEGDAFPYRAWHTSIYDPTTNRLVVFGGEDANGVAQSNMWLLTAADATGYQPGQWSDLATPWNGLTPPARYAHSAVYDQTHNLMIIFGGCVDPACLLQVNDTWVLSNANGNTGTPVWTQLFPSGTAPGPRGFHEAIYDAVNNRMIVFGGENATQSFTDVWALTNANGTGGSAAWVQLTPSGGPPESLNGGVVVYDQTNNIATAFGGYPCVNSVWTLSNANGLGATPVWTNIIANGAVGSPGCRASFSGVYDATNNRMIIYGGNSDLGIDNPDFDFVAYSDVWVLANANGLGGAPAWTQLHPKGFQPVGRLGHTAYYDAVNNKMGIFGGFSVEGSFYSVWVLTHANGL